MDDRHREALAAVWAVAHPRPRPVLAAALGALVLALEADQATRLARHNRNLTKRASGTAVERLHGLHLRRPRPARLYDTCPNLGRTACTRGPLDACSAINRSDERRAGSDRRPAPRARAPRGPARGPVRVGKARLVRRAGAVCRPDRRLAPARPRG